ncbi:MAG: MFS transporter [Anaerolineae bacterium]
MLQLVKIFTIIMLTTSSEGGMNTIFPPYLEALGLSVSRIGFVVSLFGVMQLVARLPSGALYAGHRARALLGGALALLALSTAGFAYNGGSLYLLALTLLHGFAFGAVTTVMLALTIESKPQGYSHGVTMGWYTAFISAGYAIGSSLGGFVVDGLGFQAGFGIIGSFPLLAILLVGWLPRSEATPSRPLAVQAPVAPASPWPRRFGRIDLSGLTPTILLATLVAFYINFLDDAVGTFFPLFGLSIGLSLTTIGALRIARSLAAIGIRSVAGFFFKFVDYRLLNNTAILVWSLVVLLFPEMRVGWVFLLAFVVVGLSRGLIRVTSATMVAEEKAADSRRIGLASGFYNAGLDVGAILGPPVGGLLASATDIPTMFRLVPCSLLLFYFSALILASRVARAPVSVPDRPQD